LEHRLSILEGKYSSKASRSQERDLSKFPLGQALVPTAKVLLSKYLRLKINVISLLAQHKTRIKQLEARVINLKPKKRKG